MRLSTGPKPPQPQCFRYSIDTVWPSAYPCRPSCNTAPKRPFFEPIFVPHEGSGKRHETHIPAQQNQARTHARFSCPHGNQSRPPYPEAPPRQGPCTADAIVRAAPNRFGKDNRLLNAADFGHVFERATRSRDKLFTVLCRRNATDVARLGLAISKKHCRRAASRNRIKRIVRESFRQQQELLSGLDIVVINQPGAGLASNTQLVDSLEQHWLRCSKANSQGPKKNG